MKHNPTTHKSFIYKTITNLKKSIFLAFFWIAVLGIIVISIQSLNWIIFDQAEVSLRFEDVGLKSLIYIVVLIVEAIIAVFLHSIFVVIFELPNIFIYFDEIKNKIANREIDDSIQLAQSLNNFFIKHLEPTYLNIKYSLIKILKHPIQASDPDILNLFDNKDIEEIEKQARTSQEVIRYKPLKTSKMKLYPYIIPIYLANQYLGYWVVISNKKIKKYFLDFLSDIEDFLIDDQVVHVLNSEKLILQRRFYIEMDKFSDKISLQQYKNLSDYLYDILKLTVETCLSIGGVCITVYDNEVTSYFRQDVGEGEQAKLIDAAIQIRTLNSEIRKIPEFEKFYLFILPIRIKKLRGFLYIFDNSQSNLEYFSQMLQDIENLKIDNDLEYLVSNLKLKQVRHLN